MSILSTLFGITAGIALYAGIHHLIIGLSRRPRDPTHISFALASLSAAFVVLSTLAIHSAGSIEAYIITFKFGFGLSALILNISLMWFVAFYTGIMPRRFLIAMSLWFAVIILLHLILPTGLLFAEIGGLKSITLPWGEQFVVHQQAPAYPWRPLVLDLFLLTMYGYFLYAVYRQFRSGYRKHAYFIILTIVLLIAGNIHDSLVDIEVISSIYIAQFATLFILFTMSIALSRDISATEIELNRYQDQLELLVDERTTELNRSNQQLMQEVEKRELTEAVLRQSEQRFRKIFEEGPVGMTLVAPDFRLMQTNAAFCRMLGYTNDELTALTAADISHADDIDNDLRLAQQLFTGHMPSFTKEKRFIKKNGDVLWGNLTASVIRDDTGQIAYALGIVEDVTRRKQAEQNLNQRLEELSVLHSTAELLARATDLPTSLQAISETSLHFFQARYIHIIIPDLTQDDQMFIVGFERGTGPIAYSILDTSLEALPVLDEVISKRQTQVLSNPQTLQFDPAVNTFLNERNVQHVILVPLLVRGSTTGLMTVATDDAKRNFSPDEIMLAETIASDIAAAIENTRLAERAKAVAVAEARGRLARDLHDAVTQTIYSASLIAKVLPQVWERSPEEGRRNLVKLRQLVQGALAEMRTLLFELRPSELAAADLTTLIKQLGDVLTGQTRIPVSLTVEGDPQPPGNVKVAFYRITQEAFNNVAKHSRAMEVTAELHGNENSVSLVIRDNGRGLDMVALPAGGMGLGIMRERAQAVGANLSLTSTTGQGTEVIITWPAAEAKYSDE